MLAEQPNFSVCWQNNQHFSVCWWNNQNFNLCSRTTTTRMYACFRCLTKHFSQNQILYLWLRLVLASSIVHHYKYHGTRKKTASGGSSQTETFTKYYQSSNITGHVTDGNRGACGGEWKCMQASSRETCKKETTWRTQT